MVGRMKREDIIARLRANEAELRARGVVHAALFGSRARGDDRPDSDTDIMIEIDPAARVGVYEYVGLKEYIRSLFDGPVDVVNKEGIQTLPSSHRDSRRGLCLLTGKRPIAG